MSKTYRSMFLACGACKLQVDSDAKFCKRCGRTVWLKDVDDAIISAPVVEPKPITEKLEEEKRRQQLESISRAKLQQELAKWLPTIFPDQYYVAPSPMPKEILEFLIENMGRERTYEMNILGYGYDPDNNSFFVFDNEAMYYKFLTSERIRHQVNYASIKELVVGKRQLTVKMGMVGTNTFPIFHDKALAEMLSSITGVRIKPDESNSTEKVAENEKRPVTKEGRLTATKVSEKPKASESTKPQENNESVEKPVQKISYTVNDYIRGNTTCFMWIAMLAVKFFSGMQCALCLFVVPTSLIYTILPGFFAFAISYRRPVFTSLALGYYFYMAKNTEFTGIYVVVIILLIAMLSMRYTIGEKYKAYMASNQTQQIPKEGK